MNSETLALVATYRRTMRASLERIWENVRDWEHLPWLHRRSFLDIHPLDVSLSAASQEAFRLFENCKFRLKKE